LQQQRRGFGFSASAGEDPKLHNRVSKMQFTVLSHLLSPPVLLRLTDSKYLGNMYSVNEMLSDLTKSIFTEDLTKMVNTHRRVLQTLYTERLISMMEQFKMGYDPISRASLFQQLMSIQKMMKLNPGTDAETIVHRAYVLSLIEKSQKN
jgi:hypothetical protein